MKKGLGYASALALGLVMAPGGAAIAQDGLAGLHSWVRVGGRTCMLDHFHDGSGSGSTVAAGAAGRHPGLDRLHGLGVRQPLGQLRRVHQQENVVLGRARGNYSCSVSSRPCRY